jgi:hypothetical protein
MMGEIWESIKIASAVLGFPILVCIVLIVLWFAKRVFNDLQKLFREARWERKTHKDEIPELGDIMAYAAYDAQETMKIYLDPIDSDREDTARLPVYSDQFYNHQEDINEHS